MKEGYGVHAAKGEEYCTLGANDDGSKVCIVIS